MDRSARTVQARISVPNSPILYQNDHLLSKSCQNDTRPRSHTERTTVSTSGQDELQNFVRYDQNQHVPSYMSINHNTESDDGESDGNEGERSYDGDSSYTGSIFTPGMEDRLRRRLRFFFMNPCQKWKSRRRFPWKLTIQLLKIFFVTLQLVVFGQSRSRHVDFLEKNVITFNHLYLRGWDSSLETMSYPPSHGAFAVYTIDNLVKGINHAWYQYNATKRIAIGSYDFKHRRLPNGTIPAMMIYITHYKKGAIHPSNQSYHFDSAVLTDRFSLKPMTVFNKTTQRNQTYFDVADFLATKHYEINFDAMINLQVKFSLKTVHLKALSALNSPDCFQFDISIKYDNVEHNGCVKVSLVANTIHLQCNGEIEHSSTSSNRLREVGVAILDSLVIIVSILSIVLCIRSMFRSEMLRRITSKYFKNKNNRSMSVEDNMEFINLWHIVIIINDILTIFGSAIKISIDSKKSGQYDECSMLLGTGNLLIWIGVLRYMQFFKHYNLLILTMKAATPPIMRFVLCAAFFYLGFTFCGWVVLGPYHIKFRDLTSASECLFSLVNGDDMFVTFATNQHMSTLIYIYSRIYLYVFISLFMYVVYSVFTSIIITTYETIKKYYEDGFPVTELHAFINEDPISLTSPLYRQDSEHQCSCNIFRLCLSCCRKDEFPDEYSAL